MSFDETLDLTADSIFSSQMYFRVRVHGRIILSYTFDFLSTSSGNAKPYAAKKNKGTYLGGERDDTCDHGLSRGRPLRVKNLLRVRLGSKSDDFNKKNMYLQ